MGKNTNQIATFNDLQSIGYRIPSVITNLNHCVTYGDFTTMKNETNPENQTINTLTYDSSITNKLIKWSDVPAANGQSFDPPPMNYSTRVPIILAFENIRVSSNFGCTIGLTNGLDLPSSNYYVSASCNGTLPVGTSQYEILVPINLTFPNTTYKYFGIIFWAYPSNITSKILKLNLFNGNCYHYNTPYFGFTNGDILPSNLVHDSNYPDNGTVITFGDYNDFITKVKKITIIRTAG